MILKMSDQVALLFTAVALGGIIGLFFDAFRIIRKAFRHPNILIYAEDMIFWVVSTIFVFYVILNRFNGQIRMFTVIGVFLGMILYFCTISIILLKASFAIIDALKKLIRLIVKIILFPIKKLIELLKIPVKFFLGILDRLFRPLKNSLHYSKEYVKIKGHKMISRTGKNHASKGEKKREEKTEADI